MIHGRDILPKKKKKMTSIKHEVGAAFQLPVSRNSRDLFEQKNEHINAENKFTGRTTDCGLS